MKMPSDRIQKIKAELMKSAELMIDRNETSVSFRGVEMKLIHGVDHARYRLVDGKRRAYKGYMFSDGLFVSIGVGGATVHDEESGNVEIIHFASNFDGIQEMIDTYKSLDDTMEEERSFWHQHNL